MKWHLVVKRAFSEFNLFIHYFNSAYAMQPITSAIGSSPHKLARMLAKRSTSLGKINCSHIRHTNDLVTHITDSDLRDKCFDSLDVKSLFCNVSIKGDLKAINEIVDNVDIDRFSLPKIDYLKLIHMCMRFGVFTCDSQVNFQKSGLATGSQLSPVAAVHIWYGSKERNI